MIVNNALANTMIQEIVPDRLRGRVMGFYSFVFVGLAPLGSLQVGALAERIGPPAAVALGGAATAVAVAVAAWRGAGARPPPEARVGGGEGGGGGWGGCGGVVARADNLPHIPI